MDIHSLLNLISPLIGIALLIIGSLAVVAPARMSEKFGVKVSGVAVSYVIATGIRDVFMGLVVLLLYYAKLWDFLGFVCLGIAVVAASDFVVVRANGHRQTSYVHVAGSVCTGLYGLWLVLSAHAR